MQLTERSRLILHNRVRFYHHVTDFFQFRFGPIWNYDWKPRVQWQAGYYLLEQRSNDTLVTIQRPWAGVQFRVYRNGGFSADWRNLIERHAFSGPGDFTRFRSRIGLNYQMRSGWQPFAGVEGLALRGHVVGRYAAGLSFQTSSGNLYGVGYEFRGDVSRPGAHLITTMVQFRLPRHWR